MTRAEIDHVADVAYASSAHVRALLCALLMHAEYADDYARGVVVGTLVTDLRPLRTIPGDPT